MLNKASSMWFISLSFVIKAKSMQVKLLIIPLGQNYGSVHDISHIQRQHGWDFNPFTLKAAKTGPTILQTFSNKSIFLENIWRRNVNQKPNNNSPTNILWTFPWFLSYFQKYESSRWYFREVTLSVNGLNFEVLVECYRQITLQKSLTKSRGTK